MNKIYYPVSMVTFAVLYFVPVVGRAFLFGRIDLDTYHIFNLVYIIPKLAAIFLFYIWYKSGRKSWAWGVMHALAVFLLCGTFAELSGIYQQIFHPTTVTVGNFETKTLPMNPDAVDFWTVFFVLTPYWLLLIMIFVARKLKLYSQAVMLLVAFVYLIVVPFLDNLINSFLSTPEIYNS